MKRAGIKVVLTLIVVLTVYVLIRGNAREDDYNRVVAGIDDNVNDDSNAQTTASLAVVDYSSISLAEEVLNFRPLRPGKLFGSELAGVQTEKVFNGKKANALYLLFAKNGSTYLRVAQINDSEFSYDPPDDSTKLGLLINGKVVSGYYVQLKGTADGNRDYDLSYLEGEVGIPYSFIAFVLDDLYVEVSEYGGLTKLQLVEVAQSLKY